MARVVARCRVCGARVPYFGDTCEGCDTEGTDGLAEITAADIARLRENGDTE